MSFRWKTILGIAAIELIFLSILVWQASDYIENQGEAAIEKRARDTILLASTVMLDSLISVDIASLEEQISQIGRLEGVTYARLDRFGTPLVETDSGPTPDNPDKSVANTGDGIYDIHHELNVSGQTLGTLKVGFSVDELRALTREAQVHLYAIAAIELIFVGICSWLLASYLTRRLIVLRDASRKLELGQTSEPIIERGKDEVSDTVHAFNRMSSTLQDRESALREANQELLRVNEQLAKQQQEVRTLFDSAPDGIAMLGEGHRVVYANKALESLFEIEDSFELGVAIGSLLIPEEGDYSIDRIADSENGSMRLDTTFHAVSGRTVNIEMNISAIRMDGKDLIILIVRDKTYENQLARSALVNEKLKSSLVDSSLDALVTINRQGEVTDFSQSAETLFGWNKAEILGQPMADYIIPPELKAAHHKGMAHFLATGEGPLIGKRVETQAREKGGRIFPVELALTATWVDKEIFCTASIRDISERKEREKELIEAKTQAEEASTAKSRFLSYMSHEIRSPMNAVLGALDLVQEYGQVAEPGRRYLKLAQQSGNALREVVNETLDFSKIEAGHIEFKTTPFSPGELITDVQEAIRAKCRKPNLRISLDLCENLPRIIIADRVHFQQVLTILMDNAQKFTERGEVNVVATVITEDTTVARLRVEVRDTGPGIPEDLAERIFQDFEQVDAMRDSGFGGTGLGLAIAKKLVIGMKGSITVESKVGVGSTFIVEMPFEEDASIDNEPASANAVDGATLPENGAGATTDLELQSELVLLVDDVEANLIIGAELLKSRGYCVDVAENGKAAVERAAEKEYAVILMDMRMPVLNGLDAAVQIRNSSGRNCATPIIALTANAEQSEINRCLTAGMNDFVSKPFNIDCLNQAIRRCLEEVAKEDSDMRQAQNTSDGEKEVLLSTEVLDQLGKDTSVESLPMMISVFINEIKKRMEGINRAAASGDEEEIREQAHALKSCSGTFGGLRLQDAARHIEDLASERSAGASEDVIADLRTVAEETLETYSRYREELTTSASSPE